MAEKACLKLSDKEKKTYINFCKENPVLGNSEDPNYKNEVKRSLMKIKLTELFDDKYSEELLEKTFYSLRTAILVKIRKIN